MTAFNGVAVLGASILAERPLRGRVREIWACSQTCGRRGSASVLPDAVRGARGRAASFGDLPPVS